MAQNIHTQQLRGEHGITLRRKTLRLDVTRGPDKKRRCESDGDRIVVGSHESCDLVLTDPTVSRQHFEVVLVPDGYRVRDLSSLNGLTVNGLRAYDVLADGAVTIELGTTRIKLAPTSNEVDLELSTRTRVGSLLGRSAAMRRVFDVIERVAPTPSTLLITGESGTGKEVTARTVHELSGRSERPFVVVDCGALPPTLIESELYGHERGAFTGADRAHVGAFERASGGTLFLDEIGELPLDLQTRLLGVIERRQIQPLGGRASRDIDVRVLAATNRDLRQEVNRGGFRADLYFRIAVVSLELPPLRERPEDIELYVDAFVEEWAEVGQPLQIGPETIEGLAQRPWPGNVRELRNALERAAALGEPPEASAEEISVAQSTDAASVGVQIDPAIPFKTQKAKLIAAYEKAYVEALMRSHAGNITRAARAAEIDRVYLLRLLDKFDMRPTKRKKS